MEIELKGVQGVTLCRTRWMAGSWSLDRGLQNKWLKNWMIQVLDRGKKRYLYMSNRQQWGPANPTVQMLQYCVSKHIPWRNGVCDTSLNQLLQYPECRSAGAKFVKAAVTVMIKSRHYSSLNFIYLATLQKRIYGQMMDLKHKILVFQLSPQRRTEVKQSEKGRANIIS